MLLKNNSTIDELKEFLPINDLDFPDHCMKQAEFYRIIGERQVEATIIKDLVEDELEVLEASLDNSIRTDARDNNNKITEKEIEKLIIKNPDRIEKFKEFLKAKEVLLDLNVLLQSALQKGEQLKVLGNYMNNFGRNEVVIKASTEVAKEIKKDSIKSKIKEIKKEKI